MARIQLGILISLLLVSLSFSYYADLDIDVSQSGEISIDGLTDYPPFQLYNNSDFVFKNGLFWTINMTTPVNFSSYVYELTLPKGAVINYIKTAGINSIREKNGRIAISAIGDDEPFKLVVQYRLASASNYLIFLLSGLLIAVAVLLLWRKKSNIDYSLLTEREKSIVKLIEKNKKMSQRDLMKLTGLPKASLSRNIKSLEKKGVIRKVRKGMVNMIVLK